MRNATDLQKNLGKELSDQTFLLAVSYEELTLIKALAQNPHPSYQAEPSTMNSCASLFHDTRDIFASAQREHFRSEESAL